jgi:hypothetical protein
VTKLNSHFIFSKDRVRIFIIIPKTIIKGNSHTAAKGPLIFYSIDDFVQAYDFIIFGKMDNLFFEIAG